MSGVAVSGEHSFFSKMREGIKIDGVSEVLSFDDRGVSLNTVCGSMAVEGEGLRVTTLNTDGGIVEIRGKINGIYYFEDKPAQKRKLFRRTD